MKIKALSLTFFVLCAGFTGFSFFTNALPAKSKNCSSPIVASLATWDSGCFYEALYEDKVTVGQISYERTNSIHL